MTSPASGDQVAESPEPEAVADPVAHNRPAVVGLELVRVMPERVRTAGLRVDETPVRIPILDATRPAHRHAVQAQRIVEGRTFPQLLRTHPADVELEKGRRNPFEVAGIREEREYLVDGVRQPLLALEPMIEITTDILERRLELGELEPKAEPLSRRRSHANAIEENR